MKYYFKATFMKRTFLRLPLAAYDTGAGASGMKTNKQTREAFLA